LRDSLTLDAKGDERFDAIDYEIARLTRLIDGLLALGRSGVEGVEQISIDATSVVSERVESWCNLADEVGVSIVSRIEAGVWLTGVPTAVEQIIDVFLDNALSVSAPGHTILVDLETHGSNASLCIRDEGPGMKESDLPRAFERFWRGDAKYEGTGLGLALVEQLAEGSGATVRLQNRTPQGLNACVEFSLGPVALSL
jgi:signal transduction histidine kinase